MAPIHIPTVVHNSGDPPIAGNVILFGGNNITLSQGANVITISAGAGGAGGSNTLGMSNLGNTSGTSGVVSGSAIRYLFAGGNNITLSQSLDAASVSGTITISAGAGGAAPTLSRWCNMGGDASAAMSGLGTAHGTVWVFPLTPMADAFMGNMTVSTVLLNMSGAPAGSSSYTMSMSLGIYTIANSTALSLLYIASSTFGRTTATNQSTAFSGQRWWTLHSSQFSNSASNATTPSFSDGGVYYGALLWRSSNQTKALSHLGLRFLGSAQRSGTMGVSQTTGSTSSQWYPFMGLYSSATMPTVISRSSINAVNASAAFIPCILFENQLSAF